MSILESMRSGTDSPIMQVVLGAVVVSFVFLGMGVYGDRTETVATVNGEVINSFAYGRAVGQEENRLSGRSAEPLSEDDRAALRERVLQDMIRRAALLQEASALGVEVSDGEVAKYLLDVPFLKNAEGRFDTRTYKNFLQRQGTTRANFEQQIREDLMLRKLEGLMRLGASVSEPLVRQTYIENNTKLDIEYVRIRPTAFRASVEPTEDEIATWITENGEQLQAEYDRKFAAEYDIPEVLDLGLVRLGVQTSDDFSVADLKPKMDQIVAELEGGADFAAVARKWSEDSSAAAGGSLGEVKITALGEDVVAALEGVEPGSRTKIVVGARDLRVYQVFGRTPARVVPVTEVQNDLALALIKESQAPAMAVDFATQTLLPAWREAGEAPTEELEKYQLRVATTGLIAASGQGGGLFKPPADMLDDARTAEPGAVLPEVYESEGIYWVGRLSEREDADMEAFEEDHDRFAEIALFTRRQDFFQGWVADVVARADVQR